MLLDDQRTHSGGFADTHTLHQMLLRALMASEGVTTRWNEPRVAVRAPRSSKGQYTTLRNPT